MSKREAGPPATQEDMQDDFETRFWAATEKERKDWEIDLIRKISARSQGSVHDKEEWQESYNQLQGFKRKGPPPPPPLPPPPRATAAVMASRSHPHLPASNPTPSNFFSYNNPHSPLLNRTAPLKKRNNFGAAGMNFHAPKSQFAFTPAIDPANMGNPPSPSKENSSFGAAGTIFNAPKSKFTFTPATDSNPFGAAPPSQNDVQQQQANPFGAAPPPQNDVQQQTNPFGAAPPPQNDVQQQANPFGAASPSVIDAQQQPQASTNPFGAASPSVIDVQQQPQPLQQADTDRDMSLQVEQQALPQHFPQLSPDVNMALHTLQQAFDIHLPLDVNVALQMVRQYVQQHVVPPRVPLPQWSNDVLGNCQHPPDNLVRTFPWTWSPSEQKRTNDRQHVVEQNHTNDRQHVDEQKRTIDELNRVIQESNCLIDEQRQGIDVQKRTIAEQNRGIENQKRIIAENAWLVDSQNQRISEHFRNIEEQKHAIAEQKRILDDQQRQIDNQQRNLDEQKRNFDEQQHVIDGRKRKLDEEQHVIDERKRQKRADEHKRRNLKPEDWKSFTKDQKAELVFLSFQAKLEAAPHASLAFRLALGKQFMNILEAIGMNSLEATELTPGLTVPPTTSSSGPNSSAPMPNVAPSAPMPSFAPSTAMLSSAPSAAMPNVTPSAPMANVAPSAAMPSFAPSTAMLGFAPSAAMPNPASSAAMPNLAPSAAMPTLAPSAAMPNAAGSQTSSLFRGVLQNRQGTLQAPAAFPGEKRKRTDDAVSTEAEDVAAASHDAKRKRTDDDAGVEASPLAGDVAPSSAPTSALEVSPDPAATPSEAERQHAGDDGVEAPPPSGGVAPSSAPTPASVFSSVLDSAHLRAPHIARDNIFGHLSDRDSAAESKKGFADDEESSGDDGPPPRRIPPQAPGRSLFERIQRVPDVSGTESADTGADTGEEEPAQNDAQTDLVGLEKEKEGSDVLFEASNAAFYRLDKQAWAKKGLGSLLVLKDQQTGARRILMKTVPGGRVVVNTLVGPHGGYRVARPKQVTLVVGESGPCSLRFGSAEEAEGFVKACL
ncbi:hypothetical protein NA57DRAFT_54414 [Rhizodiscina lignyota]|uniref:RanBD1 domain-containing protein n=1 Tax=Rhizodiscina lignyota TaxID=1504668 RepID=A0A9P4IKV1_9PEZI|nr:hypothetical protein NA57DRAFT_54414 [Rhizodiscina lignyota]